MGCNSQPDSQSENPDSAEGMVMESRMCSAHRFYLCEWGEHGLSRQISLPLTGSSKGDQVTEPTHQDAFRTDTAKKLLQKLFPCVLILHVRSKFLASDYWTTSKSKNLKKCAYNKVIRKVRGREQPVSASQGIKCLTGKQTLQKE